MIVTKKEIAMGATGIISLNNSNLVNIVRGYMSAAPYFAGLIKMVLKQSGIKWLHCHIESCIACAK